MESVKKLCIIFPKKENKKLTLEVDFGAPVLDLIESLEKYLTVPETNTVGLYRDEREDAHINENKTLEEHGVEPGMTLFAFVKDRGLSISFKTIDTTKTINIQDKMVKLKDLKSQIFSTLNLPSSRPYDFIRLSDGTVIQENTNFMNFNNLEVVLVKEVPIAGSA